MMSANNVIEFPNKNKLLSGEPKDMIEVTLNVNQIRFNHINETLQAVVPMIFSNIELAGFDFIPNEDDEDPNIKDGALLVECLRSMLCKHYNIEHPLQRVAEELFIRQDDDSFTLADTLVIDFEKGNG
ncbi:hypothetical protein UFOVP132_144 [uncultured Caudovirales phage]|uniref:Uncharacterized protein n=1 Tax=uncultured Caudovirales phage TaxID=2100421 RepID=A0A6J5LAK9_9CAUD|nr:hypothetical protein UFOVP132_144 [uncultured Caudovirales phage]